MRRDSHSTAQWKPFPAMTNKRVLACAVALDGKLFVMGGHDGDNGVESCETYQRANDFDKFFQLTTKLRKRKGIRATEVKQEDQGMIIPWKSLATLPNR